MSVTYDWSPVFQAVQGLGSRLMYQKALQAVTGGQDQTGVPQQQQAPAAPAPLDPSKLDPEGNPLPAAAPAPAASPMPGTSPMSARMAQMMPLLKMLPPSQGLPLLLQYAMKTPEYDASPHDAINPATGKRGSYIIDKNTGTQHWLDSTPETKVEVSNGQAYDPNATAPGTVFPLQDRVKVSGGMASQDGGKTWNPIPGYTAQQSKIAEARASGRPAKPPNPNAPITLVHPSAGY